MRDVVQIVRFYLINKTINARTIKSLLDNPTYNPLLTKCVNTVKRHPDWAIEECHRQRKAIDERKFKFDSGSWAMDVREEDIPKGIEPDYIELKEAFREIIDWIKENRKEFTAKLKRDEERRME